MKNFKSFYILFFATIITGCAPFGRLYKEQSRVTLALPANRQILPEMIIKHNSTTPSPVLNYTFISANGDSIPVGMSVEWDSIHNENLTTMALDEVVVSANSIRNTAERNGLINVEFVVTVPQTLQKDNWMVKVRPVLLRGETPDSLKELRFTGQRFREKQERDYRRYDRFVEKIIPDSADFYQTYVNYRSFERYLERLKWYKRGLEKRWAIQEAKKRRPDPLLLRFEMFNRQTARRDSLMKNRMLKHSYRMITRQWWQYDRITDQADKLVTRKSYFYDKALHGPFHQAERMLYNTGGVDSRLYDSRFGFFNDKMERMNAALCRHFRAKSIRAESHEGIKFLRKLLAGRDTVSSCLNRNQQLGKYTRRYEKIRDLLPMFHFRRPDLDTLPPLWLATARFDTIQTRRKLLSKFSKEEIDAHYGLNEKQSERQLETSRIDSAVTVGRYIRRYERLRSVYPQYRLMRELSNIHPPAQKHAALQTKYEKRLARINSLDSTNLMKRFYNTQKIARNEARKTIKDEKFYDIVRFPFNPEAQLDTIIYATDRVQFFYSQKVPADENSARMKVYIVGDVISSNGNKYPLPKSDTLTYLVSSMIKFIDKTPRFVRKIVTRDAEANTSVNFYFPQNGFHLDETLDINRKGVKQVHDLTLALMTDPVYIIDSLTLFATSSPEGNWRINGEIAQKRAESIREVLVRDFKQLHDSLAIGTAIEMDEGGNIFHRKIKDEIPNLPELIKIHTIPEDWDKLRRLIVDDRNFKGKKDAILRLIDGVQEPDRREWLIKSQYKTEYAYMFDKLYPVMRAVDFRFSLSRRGMQQDTIYTDEPDTTYARALEYLDKRKYKQALEILRSYEDVNTAIAYMSLGYDKAALRILEKFPQTAETNYMQAILNARLGNEQQAVKLLIGAAEMNSQMKSRANLDPELSVLVKKYRLFQEDDF